MAKITLTAAQALPLDKLVASAGNVRRIKAGISIADLAEDIGRRGLLQSLNVRPMLDGDGTETGRYGVVAGGRRFAALQMLVKAKRLAKNASVPCIVRHEGVAEEDSLAENTMREALHPLDQFRAFQALREEHGIGDDEIAARFFVTPAVVRQRLRLAAVSPRLLDLYAEDALTLEQLMAFSVSADHARQEAVWEALSRSHGRDAYTIRRLLTETSVRASDKRAVFVGLDAYAAAGGAVDRDLFAEDGGGYLRDVALLSTLVAEKLEIEAERVRQEGWLWIEAAAELPYGHQFGLRRLQAEAIPLGEDERAERDRLQAEYDGLEARYAAAEDLPDEVDRRLAEIEQRLTEIGVGDQVFGPDDVARAGAFVGIDCDGSLKIERGFVRPADEVPQPKPEGADGSAVPDGLGDGDGSAATCAAPILDATASQVADPDEDEPDDGGQLPDRLVTELTAHRTVALRAALSSDPDAALLALLHALALRTFYGSAAETCLEIEAKSVGLAGFAPGLNDAAASRTLVEHHAQWQTQLPRHARDLWVTLVELDADSRAALLAVCVGRSVNAVVQSWDRRPRAVAHADLLAAHVGLDMASKGGWVSTVESYLGLVTKARILAAVREAKGEAAAERIASLRKSEMAQAAEDLLAGTGWLPGPLRTPGRSEPWATAGEAGWGGERRADRTQRSLIAAPGDVDLAPPDRSHVDDRPVPQAIAAE